MDIITNCFITNYFIGVISKIEGYFGSGIVVVKP